MSVVGFGAAGTTVLSVSGSLSGNTAAGGGGGGLHAAQNVSVLAADVQFTANAAVGGAGGGALVSSSEAALLSRVGFSGNRAAAGAAAVPAAAAGLLLGAQPGEGGALALEACGEAALVECALSDNAAESSGGAIVARGVLRLSASATAASNNRAHGRGGALAAFAVASALLHNGTALAGNAVSPLPTAAPAPGFPSPETCSAAAGSLSRGGALWVDSDSAVGLRNVRGASNEALSGDGGFAFIESGGSVDVESSVVAGNAAASGSGGAFVLSGSARLAVTASALVNNTAYWGGVAASLGFNAQLGRWDATVANATITGNTAYAGGVWAVTDGAYPPAALPSCAPPCAFANNTATGYGDTRASPPRSFSLTAPPEVFPGAPEDFTVLLLDAWNQTVPEAPGVYFMLECVAITPPPRLLAALSVPAAGRRALLQQQAQLPRIDGGLAANNASSSSVPLPAPAAAGTASSGCDGFEGDIHAVHGGGAAVFRALAIRKEPRSTVRLRATAFGWPQGLRPPQSSAVEVAFTVSPCGRLAAFDPAFGSCACVPGAARRGGLAAGPCECSSGHAVILAVGRESCSGALPLLDDGSTAVVAVAGFVALLLLLLTLVLLRRARRHGLTDSSFERFVIPPQQLKVMRSGSAGQDPAGAESPNGAAGAAGAGGAPLARGNAGSLASLQSVVEEAGVGTAEVVAVVGQGNATGRKRVNSHQKLTVEYRGMTVLAVDVFARVDTRASAARVVGRTSSVRRAHSAVFKVGAAAGDGAGHGHGFFAASGRVSLSQQLDGDAADDDAADGGIPSASLRGSAAAFRPDPARRVAWGRSNLIELCELRHPHIIQTFGASELRGRQVLIEEMHRVSLWELLRDSEKYIDFASLGSIATGIVGGARYLHELRPPRVAGMTTHTIFVDGNWAPKIRLPFLDGTIPLRIATTAAAAGFGGAGGRSGHGAGLLAAPGRSFRGGLPSSSANPSSSAYPEWTVWDPPETIRNGEWTPARDVFAYGIILFELLTRREPFADHLESSTLAEVLRAVAERDLRPQFPESASKPLRDLAIDCWHRNPHRRPKFAEVSEILAAAIDEARTEMTEADLQRQQRTAQKQLLSLMVVELASATDEEAIVRVAADALAQLVPGFAVAAVASISQGERGEANPTGVYQLAVNSAVPELEADVEAALRPGLDGRRRNSMHAPTSLEHLLFLKSQVPVSSSTTTHTIGSFEDWSSVARRLARINGRNSEQTSRRPGGGGAGTPDEASRSQQGSHRHNSHAPSATARRRSHEAPGRSSGGARPDAPRAWAKLLRSGQEIVGFMSTVFVLTSTRMVQQTEELLNEEFSEAVARALQRVQSQRQALAKERNEGLQKLQQRFLQRMSHEVRRARCFG